jgi:hypothetical protein
MSIMDTRDSFITLSYHGAFVHICQNRTTGKEEIRGQVGDECKSFKNMNACNRWIFKQTKSINR